MRAITVRQPWALHIIQSGKDVENRSRNIAGPYRGPVAIHAALKADEEALRRLPGLPPNGIPRIFDYGAIIGLVDLVGVHESRLDGCGVGKGTARLGELIPLCSEWAMPWDYHLVLANPRPLPEPIPCRGRLGLWTVPDDIAARIEAAS